MRYAAALALSRSLVFYAVVGARFEEDLILASLLDDVNALKRMHFKTNDFPFCRVQNVLGKGWRGGCQLEEGRGMRRWVQGRGPVTSANFALVKGHL